MLVGYSHRALTALAANLSSVISRLDIQNLRSFKGPRSLDLAPITLVYGPNSAGKSTLIQSLCVLAQTFERVRSANTATPPTLELRGRLVDLGSFETAVHRHETERRLAIGASVERRDGPPLYCGLTFSGSDTPEGSRQVGAQIGFGDDEMRFAVTDEGRFVLDRENQEVLKTLLQRGTGERDATQPRKQILEAIRQRGGDAAEVYFDASARRAVLPELPVPRTWLAHAAEQDHVFTEWWVTQIYEPCRAFIRDFDRLAYLGPVRAAPSRFQTVGAPQGSAQTSGEYTTRLLAENSVEARDGEFVSLVDDVNRWMRILDIGYELSVSRLEANAGLSLRDVVVTALVDRAGVVVTPQDVGYGVSQLLPIVVQLCAGRRATVCIEQPEVHIHPKLQTELADLLIESTRADGFANQVIIETHSEHLLLRLQTRIKTGEIAPELVSVLYIDRDKYGDGVDPRRLRLNGDGRLADKWPEGFFDERAKEIFS